MNAGDVASVTCVVTKGDFPIDISWMFQNQLIDDKREDIIVSNVGKRGKQLSIEAVKAGHAGEYTCIASNVAGSTTRTASLDVNGTHDMIKKKIIYFDSITLHKFPNTIQLSHSVKIRIDLVLL